MSLQEVRRCKRELARQHRVIAWWAHNWPAGTHNDSKAATVTYWFAQYERLVENLMAAAKATKKNVPVKPEWKGFVNYVLSVDDKNRFKEWDIDDHDLFALVAGDVASGYKISVSYNAQNDTFVATYMCNSDGDANQGYMLSAFAPDWYNAVKSLVFKHNVVLECVWPVGKSAEKDSWG